MAATLLGRHKTPCLGCGFENVHVKANEGKHAYLYCPECGLTVPARNGRQAAGLMAGLRPEKHTNAPELARSADEIKVAPAPAPAAHEVAPPLPQVKKQSGWATMLETMK